MMTANKAIVAELKKYDKYLHVKWNNRDGYFEVWRKCLGGDRLVTPVCPNIYDTKGEAFVFTPLDRRIVAWIWAADSWRVGKKEHKKNWDRRFWEIIEKRKKEKSDYFRQIAKENYAFMQNLPRTNDAGKIDKFRHKRINDGRTSFLKPDLFQSQRIAKRSEWNMRQYFGALGKPVRTDFRQAFPNFRRRIP